MEKRPSLLRIDTTAVHLSSRAPAGSTDASPHTPLSATRKRMTKVMRRLKKPNWNRRSRTASEALSEGHAASFSESRSSFSSSLLESCSCVSVEEEKNSEEALSPKETTTAEQPKRDNNSDRTAVASNKECTVSSATTTSESCIVLSKKRSTVAVQSDLDQWCKFSWISDAM